MPLGEGAQGEFFRELWTRDPRLLSGLHSQDLKSALCCSWIFVPCHGRRRVPQKA